MLIYLGAPLQSRIIKSFHYALKEDGYLLLGKSESVAGYPGLFTLADRRARVYAKGMAGALPAPGFSHVPAERAAILPLPILEAYTAAHTFRVMPSNRDRLDLSATR